MTSADARLRGRLVGRLERASAIRSPEVREAFLATPREAFIPSVATERGLSVVYRDEAFPTKLDAGGGAISSSSQPQIMALMLEELRLSPGDRVLEIGAGTGYNAALLAHLVGRHGHVTSIELDPELGRSARDALRSVGRRAAVIVGDGRSGWSQNAPYDRIIVTASSLDVPRMWRNQLKDGGLVVLPLRLTDSLPFRQIVVAFRREEDRLVSQSVLRGGFMRLRANPADRSLPWPALTAVASDDGPERHVATISGESLRMMSKDVNRRLLSLLLTEPRSRSLPLRAKGWHQYELESFIALSAPEERLVGYVTEKVEGLILMSTALPALVDGGGDGLAGLAGGRSISRIDAYGRRSPDIALARMTDAWIRAGRPTVDRLCVTVAYDGRRPHVWKAVKRGESTIGFDWR